MCHIIRVTYRDIATLASACRSDEESWLLVCYEHAHQLRVTDCVHGGHDDLIEQRLL